MAAAGPATDADAAAAVKFEGDRWERRDGGREACGELSPLRVPENEGIGVGPCMAAASVELWSTFTGVRPQNDSAVSSGLMLQDSNSGSG